MKCNKGGSRSWFGCNCSLFVVSRKAIVAKGSAIVSCAFTFLVRGSWDSRGMEESNVLLRPILRQPS